ncbi:tetratricopeptide repeat protein, partial [Nocardioides stalactiti]|uniref:tetratricopeptide repeat protein n=1 Tax=Nocardioides stalactiti TaxID=2755356 RepID=UPI00160419DE
MQDLLELAFDAPDVARHKALAILEQAEDSRSRSFAHQALGIVHREAGDVDAALACLWAGVREASASADVERTSDVRATLGGTLVLAGQTGPGLDQLEQAVRQASGTVEATARMRMAFALNFLGRSADARSAMLTALAAIDAVTDPIWYARTLNNLAWVELRLGLVDVAESRLETAEKVFRSEGAVLEVLDVLANRGDIAEARGDYPAALGWYAAAGAAAMETVGRPRPELAEVWAAAYLAVGLVPEAVALLEEVLAHPMAAGRQVDLRLALATALLTAGEAAAALQQARTVQQALGQQGRDWGRLRADLVAVRAREALRDHQGLAAAADEVARALHERRAEEAALALLLAGRLGEQEKRLARWGDAASYRAHPNGLVRASAWTACVLAREQDGRRSGLLRAASAGLDAIDEHRRLMGSSELRALATTHGRELTEIALRHAAHDPRTLLRWSERTRATALAQPPATSDAATIPASLAALRDNGRRLA